MLGRTHIALGIASSLVLIRPTTVSGVISSLVGGALGGWIVDVDIKNRKADVDDLQERESVYDGIINALFISAFIVADFFIGKGICQYVIDNWNTQIWVGLLGFIILLLIGFNTKHRTFTHSILGMALFSTAIYFWGRPAALPFFIGYASHLIADLFNMVGIQLFFPFKRRLCLKLCKSNKEANRILFYISLIVAIGMSAILFVNATAREVEFSVFSALLRNPKLFGLNWLQLHLIIINVIAFFGFQKNWKLSHREKLADEDESVRIQLEFETWFLNFYVFIGGGIGLLISLLIHLNYPSAYNGNRWAICYSSILFWFTIYCFICNPFGFAINKIGWISMRHLPLLLYVIGINAISALVVYSLRKKRFDEYSPWHTLVLLLGAIGGTVGAIPVVIAGRREGKYHYVTFGFFIMLFSQIIFVSYMMMAGQL